MRVFARRKALEGHLLEKRQNASGDIEASSCV